MLLKAYLGLSVNSPIVAGDSRDYDQLVFEFRSKCLEVKVCLPL